ncbi:peptidoglycan-binding protein [Rhodobacter sp. Har01]|uniref:peptidoglycan-binding domain-containing protein n=1 Tax=Rhodobacter sp. Har01 TaxID=2883999 RepID=UPI001D063414|nr:peptidoglycan-binding protein [Rhodobacter sp. Har01]MCB6178666.1 peptidoglycan-binding protein [Rhodobacter sp. Har01]
MNRLVFLRSFALACAAATLCLPSLGTGPAAAQDRAALQQALEGLSAIGRTTAQTELRFAGVYQGAIDGRYGRGTEAALIAGAAFMRDNSRGKVVVDLTNAAEASAYVRGLAEGAHSAWLYGEGGECDGC